MHKGIYFLLGIIALIFDRGVAQAQWSVEPSPSRENLNAISFINSSFGWIVGDNGTMLYKSNGRWINYKSLTSENLFSVCMIDRNNGWAVGSGGVILRFNGKSWESIPSPTRKNLYSVSITDSISGVAVGARGTILVFNGEEWKLIDKSIKGNLYTVSFKDDRYVFGGGIEGIEVPIFSMLNDNTLTLKKSFNPYVTIRGISQFDSNNAWAVGARGSIFRFDGTTWAEEEITESLPSMLSVFASAADTVIGVGCNGTILINDGLQWQAQSTPTEEHLKGTAIIGSTFYAVGEKGTILSMTNGSPPLPSISEDYRVSPRLVTYPNPCSEVVNLILSDERDGLIDGFRLLNSKGQIILQETFGSGRESYSHQINVSNITNGLYFIESFLTDGRKASGKFIVKH
jgi:photosystem II stability/assembly factor-like uncharacterized protein